MLASMSHFPVRKVLVASGVVVGAVAARLLLRKTEEPPFTVLRTQGGLEIRRYEPQVRAETLVDGEQIPALNTGFHRLAGYIFGGNVRRQQLGMTAPVSQQGEKIAMTAPVGTQAEDGRWRVSFIMPAGRTLETLPAPNDPRVVLRVVPARTVAVLRFSGWVRPDIAVARQREARARLAQHGLTAVSEPVLAQYDPPWRLPFLKRNEILIDLVD